MYKIIANWKMYLTVRESRELAAQLVQSWQSAPCPGAELVLCPSDVALRDVADQVQGSGIKLGAQEVSMSANLGAFTGQTAAQQLREAGCDYVILGHSELRQFFGLTNQVVRLQVQVASQHRLHPIVCVGETEAERKAQHTDRVIITQLHEIFEGLPYPAQGLSVAYEPRWAIGTGKPVDPAEAERVHELIKHTLREFFGELRAQDTTILYGGSVNPDNALDFLRQPAVRGILVGSASTKPESMRAFISLIQSNFC